ncbi:MAG TPA: MMPL family transporter, partial [Planctomycetaceae bacterium]|nr:MMPL family transporter [Planctomycetaceae bacterium]
MPHPRGSLLTRLVDALVRHRRPILLGTIVVSIISAVWASRLTFDQSIEALYASDDPHLQAYVESKRLFGGDELVGVAYRDSDLLGSQGLERVRELAAELSQIAGVRPQSTQNLADGLAMASGPKLAFLRGRREQILEFFRGILVGGDNETTAVVLRLEAEDDLPIPPGKTFAELRARTIADIRAVADKHSRRYGLPTYVVGEPVQVHDMFRYVQQDGAVLGWASTALLVVVILVLFRNLRW